MGQQIKDVIAVSGEMADGEILPITFELIRKAYALAGESLKMVSVILTGPISGDSLEKLKAYGCSSIICLEHELLEKKIPEYHAQALSILFSEYKPALILAGATGFGRVVAAQLAYKLKTDVITDASDVIYDTASDRFTAEKSAPDGKKINRYGFRCKPAIVSFRQGVCGRNCCTDETECTIMRRYMSEMDGIVPAIDYQEIKKEKNDERIEDAEFIISGGRGMQGEKGFELLRELARDLGAMVGCTRPCVDAGLMGIESQVGQSGTSVHPRIYMACGISGAVQHLAGIKTENLIVLNNNPAAPMFNICDYGVVGDASTVVQLMDEKIKNTKLT